MAIKKVTLHVFICETLANMTQVSDVAPGPLVLLSDAMFLMVFHSFFLLVESISLQPLGHDLSISISLPLITTLGKKAECWFAYIGFIGDGSKPEDIQDHPETSGLEDIYFVGYGGGNL
jgi:hypothetical protein